MRSSAQKPKILPLGIAWNAGRNEVKSPMKRLYLGWYIHVSQMRPNYTYGGVKKPKFMMWFSTHIVIMPPYQKPTLYHRLAWVYITCHLCMIVVTLVAAHSMWPLQHLQTQETNVAYTNCQIILALLNNARHIDIVWYCIVDNWGDLWLVLSSNEIPESTATMWHTLFGSIWQLQGD